MVLAAEAHASSEMLHQPQYDNTSHLCDGAAVFEMLDGGQKDALDRFESRSWLRCLGWCLDDAGLDSILDSRLPTQESDSCCPELWSLAELLRLAEDHMDLCGPDPDTIRRCMRAFAGRGRHRHRWITRDQLRQQAAELSAGDEDVLTEWEVEQLLGLCGISGQTRVL